MTFTEPTHPSRRVWLVSLFHATLGLGIPLLLAFTLGCKQAKAKKEDLGPQVSGESIDSALSKALQGATLNNLRVGQSLKFSSLRRIENEEVLINMGERLIEVVKKTEFSDFDRYTMRITNTLRQANQSFQTIVTQDEIEVNKDTTMAQATTISPLMHEVLRPFDVRAFEKKRTTFHRLREFDGVLAAPPAVRMRADCGGLNPCELNVRYVQFDMVVWETDTNYQKISLDFAFTHQTPFLPFGREFDQLSGILIVDCRSTFVPVESRTVYVRDCLSLEDFTK